MSKTSSSARPLVSIGVPVRNEERSIFEVLGALTGQDYENLEILVCDNASTDGTETIARDWAARDPRVSLHRSEVDLGAAENFNRAFHVSRGKYFSWASGHDLRSPRAIRACVEALEERADVVLCYPRTLSRDYAGVDSLTTDDTLETLGLAPDERLKLTMRLTTCNAIYGVMRSSVLRDTRLFLDCLGADHVLLAELSLHGAFHQLDDALFVRIANRPPERHHVRVARTVEMLAVQGWRRRFPYTAQGCETLRGIWRSPVATPARRAPLALRAAGWYLGLFHRAMVKEWLLPGLDARRAGQRTNLE